jgi:hypothetical protein
MDETNPLVWRLRVALWTTQQLIPGGQWGAREEEEFAILAFVLAQTLVAEGYAGAKGSAPGRELRLQ